MDPAPLTLQYVIDELTLKSVNLDGQLDYHEPSICLRGGYAMVWKGVHLVDAINVAMKTERSKKAESTMKASSIDLL